MKKKNTLPVLGVLVIIIVLTVTLHRAQQVSRDMAMHPAAYTSSQNNFFQFLANFFGFGNQNNLVSGQIGAVNTATPLNPNSTSTDSETASQKGMATQES